jgi:hypothetical protein
LTSLYVSSKLVVRTLGFNKEEIVVEKNVALGEG